MDLTYFILKGIFIPLFIDFLCKIIINYLAGKYQKTLSKIIPILVIVYIISYSGLFFYKNLCCLLSTCYPNNYCCIESNCCTDEKCEMTISAHRLQNKYEVEVSWTNLPKQKMLFLFQSNGVRLFNPIEISEYGKFSDNIIISTASGITKYSIFNISDEDTLHKIKQINNNGWQLNELNINLIIEDNIKEK